jgi:hypothetical protein
MAPNTDAKIILSLGPPRMRKALYVLEAARPVGERLGVIELEHMYCRTLFQLMQEKKQRVFGRNRLRISPDRFGNPIDKSSNWLHSIFN